MRANGVDQATASRIADLLVQQDGVITRAQILDAGATSSYIRCRIRQREWVAIYPGVYLNHTGEPTWRQRAWAAVHDAAPAALGAKSVTEFGRGAVHLVVPIDHRVTKRPGVAVRMRDRFAESVDWNKGPPRLRVEEAALDLAAEARTEQAAIAVLTGIVGDRRTTAPRLIAAMALRGRISRRELLTGVLTDIQAGTCSVLEHRYLTKVERAHGFPVAERQVPTDVGRAGYRDAVYRDYGVVVELDGLLGHVDAASRDRDLERDLAAAAHADLRTVRLGVGQVMSRPCATATKLAAILASRGWTGRLRRCPRC